MTCIIGSVVGMARAVPGVSLAQQQGGFFPRRSSPYRFSAFRRLGRHAARSLPSAVSSATPPASRTSSIATVRVVPPLPPSRTEETSSSRPADRRRPPYRLSTPPSVVAHGAAPSFPLRPFPTLLSRPAAVSSSTSARFAYLKHFRRARRPASPPIGSPSEETSPPPPPHRRVVPPIRRRPGVEPSLSLLLFAIKPCSMLRAHCYRSLHQSCPSIVVGVGAHRHRPKAWSSLSSTTISAYLGRSTPRYATTGLKATPGLVLAPCASPPPIPTRPPTPPSTPLFVSSSVEPEPEPPPSVRSTKLIWSLSTCCRMSPQEPAMGPSPNRVEIYFDDLKHLESYLFAISFVRTIEAESSIDIFSCNIERAHNSLTSNDSYLEVLFAELAAVRSVLQSNSPFNRLPTELVSEIFTLFVMSSRDEPRTSLFRVMRVCSRWRAIAVTTPVLWRSPSFVLGPTFCRNTNPDASIHQIVSWIARAKSTAVTVSLTVPDHEYLAAQFFDGSQFTPACFRHVGSLSLSSPQSQLLRLLGRGSNGCTTSDVYSFNTLSLTMPTLDMRRWPGSISLRRRAPSLRDLEIKAEETLSITSESTFLAGFPWDHLTTLRLQMVLSSSVWIPLFTQCVRLQSGSFIVSADRAKYPRSPVILPELLSLRVSFRHRLDSRFFDHLIFPAIQNLHIAGFLDVNAHGLLLPQSTKLRVLILDVVDLPRMLLRQIVQAHKGLNKINVYVDDCTSNHCEVIFQAREEGHLQRLRSFTATTPMTSGPRDNEVLTSKVITWAKQATCANWVFFLFAPAEYLTDVECALRRETGLKTSQIFNPEVDNFDDPYDIFPFSRQLCLQAKISDRSLV
ncbi:hypothetical protein GGX14DRAFT_574086 [Mycena pura]|uniref:F-box domain-containing protein n=1 Tax=Mycena pura TaxID=153505 RepID=A0AAD6Y7A6_9AGAR|nr:hypothetical protein GGX14DRAFT_574086 [Mycena pura]